MRVRYSREVSRILFADKPSTLVVVLVDIAAALVAVVLWCALVAVL